MAGGTLNCVECPTSRSDIVAMACVMKRTVHRFETWYETKFAMIFNTFNRLKVHSFRCVKIKLDWIWEKIFSCTFQKCTNLEISFSRKYCKYLFHTLLLFQQELLDVAVLNCNRYTHRNISTLKMTYFIDYMYNLREKSNVNLEWRDDFPWLVSMHWKPRRSQWQSLVILACPFE